MTQPVRTIEVAPGEAPDLAGLIAAGEPALLRNLVGDWPVVRAAREGTGAAVDYLRKFDSGRPVVAYVGDPAIRGRFHYDADVTGMNFTTERMGLGDFLALLAPGREDARALYLGSTDLDTWLPGFRADNDLVPAHDLFVRHAPMASIWIGNRTIASAHYDMSNNAAACVAGRRRFTLFPPDQVANLYPGPLAPTPGGQVVSMVDFAAPDFDRFPRFRDALAEACVAEMEPGDVLVYPALWWHHVEALAPFNILVNYWWNEAAGFMDTPMNALLHAILSLRDRPATERAAWRAMFDHYVFGDVERVAEHLPPEARGPLAPLDDVGARQLRAFLLNGLNR